MLNGPTGLDLAAQVQAFIKRNWRMHDGFKIQFGTSAVGSMWSDGTHTIVDPGASGVFKVGAATTDERNAYAFRLGLGDTVATSGALLQFTTATTSIVSAFAGTMTYSGTGTTLRAMLFQADHFGSNANPNSLGALFTGNIGVDSSGSARNAIGVQAQAGLTNSVVLTQGTTRLSSLIAKAPTDSGGTHTGGILYSRSLFVEEPATIAGVGTFLGWAGLFAGDVQLFSDKKLILEGSATVKGDSYFVFDSASNEIRTFVNGTQSLTLVAAPAAYTPTNVTVDRAYDANATTTAELADVLGTLIADLQARKLIG